MRKLATIQKIADIQPIEGADKICKYKVNAWWVVDQVGKYNVGDHVVYCEVDSYLPIRDEFEFLRKSSYKKMSDGTEGFRLKTIKLRGQVSQGLILPVAGCFGDTITLPAKDATLYKEGDDVSEALGIVKYEPPIPACLSGQVKGNFPAFLNKTDEERCCDANTIIQTEDGKKTIKEICETKYSGKVKSYNHELDCSEYKSVIDWSIMTRKVYSWVKITTRSGKELIVTDNHKIFIENDKCYRESKYLKIGDMLNISKKD